MNPSPAFSYAYQPIVDTVRRRTFSYEALIRGPGGEPAGRVLDGLTLEQVGRIDELGRPRAIAMAAALGIDCRLNLNCLPRSLFQNGNAIQATLEAAATCRIPIDRLVLEMTENEVIVDRESFAEVANDYRALGLLIALDDFGAGYAGLNLLADFQPDMIKLDMGLVRHIDQRGARQAIVRAIVQACTDLGITVIAEGIETQDEHEWFVDEGVTLFQGYLFAKPAFERLPVVELGVALAR